MRGGMRMPGGWTMSMAFMRMPGQSWSAAAASFLGMWLLMMVAMMVPSLLPMLSSYRRSLRRRGTSRVGGATALAAAGYFFVWAAFGAAVYPLGLLLAAVQMRSPALARSLPLATGLVLLLAGAAQLTPWKAQRLARCREPYACAGCCGSGAGVDARGAFGHGLRMGLHCSLCCSGLIAVLLVVGVMDLRAMAFVTAAITAERLAPWPLPVARLTGGLLVASAAYALLRAASAA
jgi:predicted metal-binding membrane protein